MSTEDHTRQTVPGWAWGVVLGVVILVLGGVGVVIWHESSSGETAEARQVAERYVAAIADGDAETANEIARIRQADSQYALLASDALTEAEHIFEPSLRGMQISPEGNRGTTEVTYTLGGEKYRDSIVLERDDDGWFVSNGIEIGTLLGNGAGPIKIPGFDEVIGDRHVVAYPGIYDVLPPNEFFDTNVKTIVAAPIDTSMSRSTGPRMSVDSDPNADFWREMQERSDAQIDGCVSATDVATLTDCGFYVELPRGFNEADAVVNIEVVEYPALWEWYDWTVVEYDSFGEFTATVTRGSGSGAEREAYIEFLGGEFDVTLTPRGELRTEFWAY